MNPKIKDDEDFMESEFEDMESEDEVVAEEADLDYDDEEVLIMADDAEVEDFTSPSVLITGVSKPKTDEEWHKLLMEASSEGVPEYSIGDSYKEGDLIIHPIFGMGVVAKVRTPRKMEVIFTDEQKELIKKLMAMNVEI